MDKHIIAQLKQGDEKAFKYIYDCHYVLLCRFAYQFLNDSSLAEEIVDDTIFYLWEHHAQVEITYSLRAYLLRAVRNRCLNELNSLSHRTELRFSSFMLPENADFLDTVFVEEDHPLGILLAQELEEKLSQCIEELPKECCLVFKKSRLEQKKYEEIAEEMNISVNTVKYHIKNALSSIHLQMGDYLKLLIFYVFLGNS